MVRRLRESNDRPVYLWGGDDEKSRFLGRFISDVKYWIGANKRPAADKFLWAGSPEEQAQVIIDTYNAIKDKDSLTVSKADIDRYVRELRSRDTASGLDEAILAREGSKCTVGMLYDIAFSGTKVDIYNEKAEDYLFYREYFSDVVKEAPEILDEAAIYISAVGSKTLQINVYSDYVRDRELPNWR